MSGYGWRHHLAVKMWRGRDEALTREGLTMCAVWVALGVADTVAATLLERFGSDDVRSQVALAAGGALPPWPGDPACHGSHRPSFGDEPDPLADVGPPPPDR